MPTSVDGKNFVHQDWAWIAGSTYYVPYEAVYDAPRPEPVEDGADAGPVDDYQRGVLEGERRMLEALREPSQGMLDAAFNNKDEHMEDIWKAMLDAFEKERGDET